MHMFYFVYHPFLFLFFLLILNIVLITSCYYLFTVSYIYDKKCLYCLLRWILEIVGEVFSSKPFFVLFSRVLDYPLFVMSLIFNLILILILTSIPFPLKQSESMLLAAVGATVSVLLGFAPPTTLSAAGSSKVVLQLLILSNQHF